METVKLVLVLTLSAMLVLEGCYSSTTLSRYYLTTIPQSDAIQVHTTDGKEIHLEPNRWIVVNDPGNFIYGVGERAVNRSKEFVPFSGKFRYIYRNVQESESQAGYLNPWPLWFRLADSSIVRANPADCIVVDSSLGPGLWCTGKRWARGGATQFSGRVPLDSIETIETKSFAVVKTLLWGSLAVSIIAGALVYHHDMTKGTARSTDY